MAVVPARVLGPNRHVVPRQPRDDRAHAVGAARCRGGPASRTGGARGPASCGAPNRTHVTGGRVGRGRAQGPRAAPNVNGPSGCCQTWTRLGGVWATDPDYGPRILGYYNDMLEWLVAKRSTGT